MPSGCPPSAGGVMTVPVSTMKMLSPVHSADVALVVEHDRLGDAGVDGLDLGQDVVEVVEALDRRA